MGFFSSLNPAAKEASSLQEVLQSLLLLIIRLYFGYEFLQSGLGKFHDIASTSAFFQQIGIPQAHWNAYLVASTECVGGVLLMLGLFTRLAALVLFFVMCMAYLTAHFEAVHHLFDDPMQFVRQAPFIFAVAMLFVFAFGPQKISLDHCLTRMCNRSS
jgi:putative oxidoreductase